MDMSDLRFMRDAGQQAGQALGQAASEKINSDAGSAGQSFGQSAGQAILSSSTAGSRISISRDTAATQGVNADVGKDNAVKPPAKFSPRTPNGGGW